MDIREAIDQSGYKDKYLAKLLGIDDALFSQKKTGWRGRYFNDDEIARLTSFLDSAKEREGKIEVQA